MNFTTRQLAFITFLLDQLNFIQEIEVKRGQFNAQYLNELSKSYSKYRSLASCDYITKTHNNLEIIIPKNALLSFKYEDNGEFFEVLSFSIFNYLQLEIKVKENGWYDIIYKDSNYISASDIANFTYCPVSYAISKSIKYKILTSAKIGTELHEASFTNSLIDKNSKGIYADSTDGEILNDENFKNLSSILSDCEIIYSGHTEKEKNKYFKSAKGKFIGQPDFILRDRTTNKIFVIEEKYHNIPKAFQSFGDRVHFKELENDISYKRDKRLSYDNHINQLLSYIYGITEYDIEYGILIYWKYELNGSRKNITKCNFLIIERKDEYQKTINEIYLKIKLFLNTKSLDFDVDTRNPSKCANCVNNILCGHKTGNYNEITLPYSSKYLKINKVSFPDSLAKDKVKDPRTYMDKLIATFSPDDDEA